MHLCNNVRPDLIVIVLVAQKSLMELFWWLRNSFRSFSLAVILQKCRSQQHANDERTDTALSR